MDVPSSDPVERYLDSVIAAWRDPDATVRILAIEPKEADRIAGLIRSAVDNEGGDMGSVGNSLDGDSSGSRVPRPDTVLRIAPPPSDALPAFV